MRLFVGLALESGVRDALHNAVSGLHIRGQETRRENVHLTLAFLGEHDERLEPLQGILTEAANEHAPFPLTVTGFGYFGRRESALLYARLAGSPPLQALAGSVRRLLSEAGESFDGKPFAAHITLMRQADLTAADLSAPLPPLACTADRLTLYHSERVQGVLRYRPVFEAPFRGKGTQA